MFAAFTENFEIYLASPLRYGRVEIAGRSKYIRRIWFANPLTIFSKKVIVPVDLAAPRSTCKWSSCSAIRDRQARLRTRNQTTRRYDDASHGDCQIGRELGSRHSTD